MANKAISELPQAQNVNNQDLFVLEQSGIAKKLPAETFITEQGIINALAEALDGHGGISSVTLSSVSGRIRTYRITFTDQSATTFQVYDGTSIDRISRTSSSGLDDVYTIFLSDGTTTFFTVHNGADGTVSEAMLNDALKDKAPAVTETTESSAIANFTDGADDMAMHHVVAEINPVQDLSNGDPSPSNICPITGWTGCNVTRTGVNLFDSSVFLTASGWTETDGVYSGSCTDIQYSTIGYLLELPNLTEQITMSFKGYVDYANSRAGYFRIYYSDGTTSYIELIDQTWKNYSLTSTVGKVVVGIGFTRSNSRDISLKDFQVEIGSGTSYEPYRGNTVTVDWTTEAGTVYGGTIDVATGLLTVDRAMVTIDGTQTLQANGASSVSSRFFITPTPTKKNGFKNFISDRFFYVQGADVVGNVVGRANNSGVEFYLPLSVAQTAADGKAWFSANPTQLCYELATPQTYQLTGQQLKTLLGTNNVWADTGDTSVTYAADTKLYIEKLTMPTEDDLVANQAITSGKYFMIGNSLYLALANIASGAQITIGTNAQRVSLADALNAINS